MRITYSVVIATHNRANILGRAIDSVPKRQDVQIIVVDDASKDNTREVLNEKYSEVTVVNLDVNVGPGLARNAGIDVAKGEWVIVLDDDDELNSDEFVLMDEIVKSQKFDAFPVIQFSRSNGYIRDEYCLIILNDYLNKNIIGDFTPVINKKVFTKEGLGFPKTKIGGETLLWWHVAKIWGIPTFKHILVKMNDDADSRMMSAHYQLRHSEHYASYQKDILENFGNDILSNSPKLYESKLMGLAIYSLISGESIKNRNIKNVLHDKNFGVANKIIVILFSLMPSYLRNKAFLRLRKF